ncbi:unnamed protein product [Amoebophrya sp. A120]|nr:unnamed protein product [Amoebophrya sp. A120]|eukprot:GSA120T00005006001.1
MDMDYRDDDLLESQPYNEDVLLQSRASDALLQSSNYTPRSSASKRSEHSQKISAKAAALGGTKTRVPGGVAAKAGASTMKSKPKSMSKPTWDGSKKVVKANPKSGTRSARLPPVRVDEEALLERVRNITASKQIRLEEFRAEKKANRIQAVINRLSGGLRTNSTTGAAASMNKGVSSSTSTKPTSPRSTSKTSVAPQTATSSVDLKSLVTRLTASQKFAAKSSTSAGVTATSSVSSTRGDVSPKNLVAPSSSSSTSRVLSASAKAAAAKSASPAYLLRAKASRMAAGASVIPSKSSSVSPKRAGAPASGSTSAGPSSRLTMLTATAKARVQLKSPLYTKKGGNSSSATPKVVRSQSPVAAAIQKLNMAAARVNEERRRSVNTGSLTPSEAPNAGPLSNAAASSKSTVRSGRGRSTPRSYASERMQADAGAAQQELQSSRGQSRTPRSIRSSGSSRSSPRSLSQGASPLPKNVSPKVRLPLPSSSAASSGEETQVTVTMNTARQAQAEQERSLLQQQEEINTASILGSTTSNVVLDAKARKENISHQTFTTSSAASPRVAPEGEQNITPGSTYRQVLSPIASVGEPTSSSPHSSPQTEPRSSQTDGKSEKSEKSLASAKSKKRPSERALTSDDLRLLGLGDEEATRLLSDSRTLSRDILGMIAERRSQLLAAPGTKSGSSASSDIGSDQMKRSVDDVNVRDGLGSSQFADDPLSASVARRLSGSQPPPTSRRQKADSVSITPSSSKGGRSSEDSDRDEKKRMSRRESDRMEIRMEFETKLAQQQMEYMKELQVREEDIQRLTSLEQKIRKEREDFLIDLHEKKQELEKREQEISVTRANEEARLRQLAEDLASQKQADAKRAYEKELQEATEKMERERVQFEKEREEHEQALRTQRSHLEAQRAEWSQLRQEFAQQSAEARNEAQQKFEEQLQQTRASLEAQTAAEVAAEKGRLAEERARLEAQQQQVERASAARNAEQTQKLQEDLAELQRRQKAHEDRLEQERVAWENARAMQEENLRQERRLLDERQREQEAREHSLARKLAEEQAKFESEERRKMEADLRREIQEQQAQMAARIREAKAEAEAAAARAIEAERERVANIAAEETARKVAEEAERAERELAAKVQEDAAARLELEREQRLREQQYAQQQREIEDARVAAEEHARQLAEEKASLEQELEDRLAGEVMRRAELQAEANSRARDAELRAQREFEEERKRLQRENDSSLTEAHREAEEEKNSMQRKLSKAERERQAALAEQARIAQEAQERAEQAQLALQREKEQRLQLEQDREKLAAKAAKIASVSSTPKSASPATSKEAASRPSVAVFGGAHVLPTSKGRDSSKTNSSSDEYNERSSAGNTEQHAVDLVNPDLFPVDPADHDLVHELMSKRYSSNGSPRGRHRSKDDDELSSSPSQHMRGVMHSRFDKTGDQSVGTSRFPSVSLSKKTQDDVLMQSQYSARAHTQEPLVDSSVAASAEVVAQQSEQQVDLTTSSIAEVGDYHEKEGSKRSEGSADLHVSSGISSEEAGTATAEQQAVLTENNRSSLAAAADALMGTVPTDIENVAVLQHTTTGSEAAAPSQASSPARNAPLEPEGEPEQSASGSAAGDDVQSPGSLSDIMVSSLAAFSSFGFGGTPVSSQQQDKTKDEEEKAGSTTSGATAPVEAVGNTDFLPDYELKKASKSKASDGGIDRMPEADEEKERELSHTSIAIDESLHPDFQPYSGRDLQEPEEDPTFIAAARQSIDMLVDHFASLFVTRPPTQSTLVSTRRQQQHPSKQSEGEQASPRGAGADFYNVNEADDIEKQTKLAHAHQSKQEQTYGALDRSWSASSSGRQLEAEMQIAHLENQRHLAEERASRSAFIRRILIVIVMILVIAVLTLIPFAVKGCITDAGAKSTSTVALRGGTETMLAADETEEGLADSAASSSSSFVATVAAKATKRALFSVV